MPTVPYSKLRACQSCGCVWNFRRKSKCPVCESGFKDKIQEPID